MSFKWLDARSTFGNYWLIPLLCGFFSWRLGQDINWDFQNYHLYNAWAHWHGHYSLDLAPAGLQSFFNPLFDLPWYGLSVTLPPALGGFVLGFVHGLNFVLVRAIVLQVLPVNAAYRTWVSWCLALAALLSPGFRSELGATMHDNVVALAMLSSLLLCLRAQALPLGPASKPILLAGLLAGFTSAAKLAGAFYAQALCCALLVTAFVHERGWRARLQLPFMFSSGVILAMLAFGGYWYWFNWHYYSNPLFPILNNVFGSTLADLDDNRDLRFLPTTAAEWLFHPVMMSMYPTLASELPYRQFTSALIFLVAVVALCVSLFRQWQAGSPALPSRATLFLSVFAVVGYLLWLKLFGIYRYLITLELLLPLLWLLLWHSLLGPQRGLRLALALLLLLTVVNWRGRPDWGHAPWSDRYYSVEMPADAQALSSVLLMGQPLAWLVPAFDLPIPFLQLVPNFAYQHSDYDRELLRRVDSRGSIRVIFDPVQTSIEAVNMRLADGHVAVTQEGCKPLRAHLGGQLLQYQYCPIKPVQ